MEGRDGKERGGAKEAKKDRKTEQGEKERASESEGVK